MFHLCSDFGDNRSSSSKDMADNVYFYGVFGPMGRIMPKSQNRASSSSAAWSYLSCVKILRRSVEKQKSLKVVVVVVVVVKWQ